MSSSNLKKDPSSTSTCESDVNSDIIDANLPEPEPESDNRLPVVQDFNTSISSSLCEIPTRDSSTTKFIKSQIDSILEKLNVYSSKSEDELKENIVDKPFTLQDIRGFHGVSHLHESRDSKILEDGVPLYEIQVWTTEVIKRNNSNNSQQPIHSAASLDSENFYDAKSHLSASPPLPPDEIQDVLTQADDESRIPEPGTSERIFLNNEIDSSKRSSRKKRRRRRKWCCCCCRQKTEAATELNPKGSGLQGDSCSDWSSSSSVPAWTGCLGGMLDSRSVGTRTRIIEDRGDPLMCSVNVNGRMRRTRIPDKPNYSLNLWTLLKNSIGKELSKIPMPVNFSEPLSMLQRLTEDYEYSDILDRAAKCEDSSEQMCYVAAFTVSSYATTSVRTAKPFNPLLGETYEWDRSDDLGWRCVSEQVSHHPPTAAFHCEGKDWTCWQEFTMTSKFRGNSLEVIPMGIAHLTFGSSGNHYTWRKVTTVVRNIILGRLWVEQVGDMVITNHKNGDRCQLSYVPYSMFSKKQKEVTGTVKTSEGTVKWVLNGCWDTKLEGGQVKTMGERSDIKPSEKSFVMGPPTTFWTRRLAPPESEKYYNFSEFAVQMNELEEGVAPTDSRFRPDQRLMEYGRWDEANAEKVRIEDKQRSARMRMEAGSQGTRASTAVSQQEYQPAWFQKEADSEVPGSTIYVFKKEYWDCKKAKDWSRCLDIY